MATTYQDDKTKIRLKQNWYALPLGAFPHTQSELLQQAELFKRGTVFVDYGQPKSDPTEDPDCVENDRPYGWMYYEPRYNSALHFAHMHAPTLRSWRSWPEMFEEYDD